jgi:ACS family glucarate transporter-like MFS transporter
MNMANQFGGMITAPLTPFLAGQFGWSVGFGVAAAMAVIGAVAWLFVIPNASVSTSHGTSKI